MASPYPYIIQGSNIVVVIDNKTHTVSKTHVTYDRIKEAIKNHDWETVKSEIEPKAAIVKYGKGNISISENVLYWKGEVFNNALSKRLLDMLQEGFPIDPMINFMDNLMLNPSKTAINELYGFLEVCSLPITPDGYFLAYKKVNANYTDCHTGTIDNSVGKTVSMERSEVDSDRNSTCSRGLHFCSLDYLKAFSGERTVILKINPKDVVSIPSDHNDSKGRTCSYQVIGELTVDPKEAFTKPVQITAVGSELEDDDYDSYYVDDDDDFASTPVNQEYDKKGKPLSMTKNAIRKRAARAAKKLS